jgi:hypothetical protein
MIRLFKLFCLAWMAGFALSSACAVTFQTTDGATITGDILDIKDEGVLIRTSSGDYPPRMTWDQFTQAGLKALLSEARSTQERAMIEALIDVLPKTSQPPKDIVLKPVTNPPRPRDHLGFLALFSSSLGVGILLALYGATLLAAYEVALYKDQPIGVVCGLASVPILGILSPIYFFFIKTTPIQLISETPRPAKKGESTQGTTSELAGAPSPSPDLAEPDPAAAQSLANAVGPAQKSEPKRTIPAPVVFHRGEYSFNRRFFETRLANFQRVVPSAIDKDMVLWIKAIRGEYTGRRITQITPNDLRLQVFKADATADETIPFVEILEVQIRHKDFVA